MAVSRYLNGVLEERAELSCSKDTASANACDSTSIACGVKFPSMAVYRTEPWYPPNRHQ